MSYGSRPGTENSICPRSNMKGKLTAYLTCKRKPNTSLSCTVPLFSITESSGTSKNKTIKATGSPVQKRESIFEVQDGDGNGPTKNQKERLGYLVGAEFPEHILIDMKELQFCPNCVAKTVNKNICYICKTEYALMVLRRKGKRRHSSIVLPLTKEILPFHQKDK